MKLRSRQAAVLPALFILAACSSVSRTSSLTPGSQIPGTQTPGATTGSLPPGTSGASANPLTTTGGVTGGTGGTTTGTTTGLGSSTGATTGTVGSSCVKPVKIGISYDPGAAAGASGAGGNPGAQQAYGDNFQKLYQIGVDDLNRSGGLGGCKVQLAIHQFSTTDTAGFDAQSQKECYDFAQDQKVFVAVPMVTETRTILDCLAGFHVPVIRANPQIASSGNPMYNKSDYVSGKLYSVNEIANDRLGPVISMLKSAGYFAKWGTSTGTKVGIIICDEGYGVNKHLVNDIWVPALKALGISVETFTYNQINAFSDVATVAQQMSNAIVKFRGDGVDHVLFSPDGGTGLYFFTTTADKQAYRPRLAFTSLTAPNEMIQNVPASSRPGTMAVSWNRMDVENQSAKPATPPDAARERCDKLYAAYTKSVGVPVEPMYVWCDVLNFLKSSLAGVHGYPTAAELFAGAQALGGSLQLAAGLGSALFGRGVLDGNGLAVTMSWNDSASAWSYVSKPQWIP